ncbi:hypothetical protein [Catalinimonas niigatensis]|uniref:hypothetical protein n=1 Tax=Catalinimonas niigatensis TaxID=1397264 RepID=UPI0026650659|nr:hypothetical protein [Catalinimonas niigatensis]WPP48950.1 hypothetical protein PZB72_19985 [Catalinimonas niigatensis]
MQDFKMELLVQAKDKEEALKLKEVLREMYAEYGTQGLLGLYQMGKSPAGKMFTGKFKKSRSKK